VGGVNLYRLNIFPANKQRVSSPIGWWLPNGPASYVHADHHWLEIVPVDEGTQRFWLLDANSSTARTRHPESIAIREACRTTALG
jgi:hypothetical protein